MSSNNSRLHRIYQNMKTRCTNPNYDKYQYYGGKGVKVCPEWASSYSAFKAWAEQAGYQDDLTIERIDVNGDYTPENCCWVSWKGQANNRTSNRILTYRGKTQSMALWAEQYHVSQKTLWARLNAGWPVGRALREPTHSEFNSANITCDGVTKSVAEWSRDTGLKPTTITQRIKRGWSVHAALTTPVGGQRND